MRLTKNTWTENQSEFIAEICRFQLTRGKHFILFDSRWTPRWEVPIITQLIGEENSSTRERVRKTTCAGDCTFITDADYIRKALQIFFYKFDEKSGCPRTVDDIHDVDFIDLFKALLLELREDKMSYAAFPNEMLEEAVDEGPTLDGILTAEDEISGLIDAREEAEQHMLDEMPLPGFPRNEAERRQKWAALPRRTRAAIRRLHEMLGHKPKEVLRQVLRGSHAPPEYIEAIKYFKCDACTETAIAPKTHPVAAPSTYAFNHELHIDVFTIHDMAGTGWQVLSIVDWNYHTTSISYSSITNDFITNAIINFEETNDGSSVAWYWDFGDSTFSTLTNPDHSFSYIGNYTICLIANNQFNCFVFGLL